MKQRSIRVTVVDSRLLPDLFSVRAYDPYKGRLAGTKFRELFTEACREAGIQAGDEIRLTVRKVEK
jgi:hypothetical protein